MEKPEKPNDSDCCHSGCSPCVFEVYDDQMNQYEQNKSKKCDIICENAPEKNVLSSVKYTPFNVVHVDHINECHRRFIFQYQNQEDSSFNCKLQYFAGQHFILRGLQNSPADSKNDMSYISRPYTPIKSNDFFTQNDSTIDTKELNMKTCFQILVKLYEHGAMSKYLSNLKIGDITYWRGPYGSYEYVTNMHKNILMISQGTGIAPLYSILFSLLDNEEDFSVVTLFCCFKNIHNILFREELYKLQSNWNFKYNIFLTETVDNDLELDKCNIESKPKYKEPIVTHNLSKDYIHFYLSKNIENVLVMICGSKEFLYEYKTVAIECGIKNDCIITF